MVVEQLEKLHAQDILKKRSCTRDLRSLAQVLVPLTNTKYHFANHKDRSSTQETM